MFPVVSIKYRFQNGAVYMLENSRIKKINRRYICRFLALCLALGGTALSAAGCSLSEEEEDTFVRLEMEGEKESPYTLTEVAVNDVEKTADIWFNYRQTQTENVYFPVSGKRVAEVYVDVGDRVKEGQLLAVLEGGDRQDQIRDLEYQIARNKLQQEYLDINEAYALSERWWRFVYQSNGSDAEEEKLQSDLESTRQSYRYQREDYQDKIDMDTGRLENYKKEAEEGSIYAGMDGVIYRLGGDMSTIVSDVKQAAFVIVDDGTCLFETTKIEYADYISDGVIYSLKVGAGSSAVYYNVRTWNREEWTDKIYLELLDSSAEEKLKVGDSGRLTLELDRREKVLTVPKNAIHTADGKPYVYVLDENDFRQVKWVETGLYGDKYTEIVSGLEKGEAVILK